MSQSPPDSDPDSQQPSNSPPSQQQASGVTAGGETLSVQGDNNRVIQGNENKAVLGDRNTVIQGDNNWMWIIKKLVLNQQALAPVGDPARI